MEIFGYEFNKNKDLGENFYIYEYEYKSGICTCGHYDENIETKDVLCCSNCGTKAVISISNSKPGKNDYKKKYLDYLKFNNNEFNLICNMIYFDIDFKTSLKDDIPIYKIKKDSLKICIKEEVNLKFWYEKNKKNKYVLKTKYYYRGEEKRLLANYCPHFYDLAFYNDKIRSEIIKINYERYSSLDIWKYYSFYKNAPNLVRNGYINISASASEVKQLNSLYSNVDINPIFKDMIDCYEHVAKQQKYLLYYIFKDLFSKRTNEYELIYDIDFIKYILSLDRDLLKEIYSISTNNISIILNILYELNYSNEETNNFFNLVLRQNAQLYSFNKYDILELVTLFNKYGIEIEKNPKDIRIFIAKMNLLTRFGNYYGYGNDRIVLNNRTISLKKLRHSKTEEVIKFFANNNYNLFEMAVEILLEDNQNYMAKLLKYDNEIDDCLLLLDDKDNIVKIFYKNETYKTKEEIDMFLTEMEEECSYA